MSPEVQTLLIILGIAGGLAIGASVLSYVLKDPDEPVVPEVKLPAEKPLVPLAEAPGILGLAAGEGSTWEGVIDGAQMRVHIAESATLEASAPGIPSSLVLREEPNALVRALAGEDFTIGDEAFDDAIRVQGEPAEILTVLDSETRREALREIVKHGFAVSEGKVRWSMRAFTTGDELAAIARSAASLATRLALDRIRMPDDLAANLLTEPSPAIRLQLLRVLGSEFRGASATARAARHAAQDPDVAVRVAAASLANGADSIAQLTAVAKDRAANDRSRAAALSGLMGQVPVSELAPIFEIFLDSGSSTLAVSALRNGTKAGWQPPAATLLRLTEAVHPDARVAAATLLDAKDPAVEKRLCEMLANNEQDVVVAALGALGRGASIAAIETLLPFARARFGGALRDAASDAISKIRERNPGASSGQLTMTDDVSANAGQVSISDDRGAVSMAQHKKKETT